MVQEWYLIMATMGAGRRILIVDDETAIANSLELIFSISGYETRAAYSAEQAIEIMTEWEPDVAVVDVMLPWMNGIDFAVKLEAQYPDCAIVLMSGHPGTSALISTAEQDGHSFDILAKPLHPERLLSAVSNRLARKPQAVKV
jgi:DNA-binding NtrC family response regulator